MTLIEYCLLKGGVTRAQLGMPEDPEMPPESPGSIARVQQILDPKTGKTYASVRMDFPHYKPLYRVTLSKDRRPGRKRKPPAASPLPAIPRLDRFTEFAAETADESRAEEARRIAAAMIERARRRAEGGGM